MTDYTDIIARLKHRPPTLKDIREAADALEAQARRIAELEGQLSAKLSVTDYGEGFEEGLAVQVARIAELEAAIDKVLVAVSQSKMVPKPGCGVGGQTVDANIRGSDYLRVDAWPFEELSAARAALGEKE